MIILFTPNLLRYLSHKDFAMEKKSLFSSGRINQKLRTRSTILQTARKLLQEKGDFTLEEVAAKALISRATVYRYFSDVDTLKLEALIDDTSLTVDNVFSPEESLSLTERVDRARERLINQTVDNESHMRSLLSVILKHSVADPKGAKQRRGSRRVVLIKTAIEPYLSSISKKHRQRLVHTLAILTGIEALIVLKDVCEVNNEEAQKTIEWATDTLLKAVVNTD